MRAVPARDASDGAGARPWAPRPGRHRDGPVLVWELAPRARCIASAPLGGGIGPRRWIVNAQVPSDYERTDVEAHLRDIAGAQGCEGAGVGMLTAARVDRVVDAAQGGVQVYATVGLLAPTWAADGDGAVSAWRPGTINVVAFVSVRLADAALVNATMTVTEAKTQALLEAGVPGTGTASDAVCVVCPASGPAEPFAGPRSRIGAPLARAVHAAVARGAARGRAR